MRFASYRWHCGRGSGALLSTLRSFIYDPVSGKVAVGALNIRKIARNVTRAEVTILVSKSRFIDDMVDCGLSGPLVLPPECRITRFDMYSSYSFHF